MTRASLEMSFSTLGPRRYGYKDLNNHPARILVALQGNFEAEQIQTIPTACPEIENGLSFEAPTTLKYRTRSRNSESPRDVVIKWNEDPTRRISLAIEKPSPLFIESRIHYVASSTIVNIIFLKALLPNARSVVGTLLESNEASHDVCKHNLPSTLHI
jgi:hypothetical protein